MLRPVLVCSLVLATVAIGSATAATAPAGAPRGCGSGVTSVALPAAGDRARVRIACLHRTGSRLRAARIRAVPLFAGDLGDWARHEVAVLETPLDGPVPSAPTNADEARPSSAVAVLALDRTAGGPEYQALQAIGVPAWITTSLAEAERAP